MGAHGISLYRRNEIFPDINTFEAERSVWLSVGGVSQDWGIVFFGRDATVTGLGFTPAGNDTLPQTFA